METKYGSAEFGSFDQSWGFEALVAWQEAKRRWVQRLEQRGVRSITYRLRRLPGTALRVPTEWLDEAVSKAILRSSEKIARAEIVGSDREQVIAQVRTLSEWRFEGALADRQRAQCSEPESLDAYLDPCAETPHEIADPKSGPEELAITFEEGARVASELADLQASVMRIQSRGERAFAHLRVCHAVSPPAAAEMATGSLADGDRLKQRFSRFGRVNPVRRRLLKELLSTGREHRTSGRAPTPCLLGDPTFCAHVAHRAIE